MSHTKSKAKKTRGAAIVATLAKRNRKAGNKKQAHTNPEQGQHLRAEEAVPVRDNVSEKLDALMRMRTLADLAGQTKDLSNHVEATEVYQREVEASHASLNTSRPARKRTSPWVTKPRQGCG